MDQQIDEEYELEYADHHRQLGDLWRKRIWLTRYKSRQVCAICGKKHSKQEPLEFHHLERHKKLFNISEEISIRSLEEIVAEIAKCEPLCHHCHELVDKRRRRFRRKPQFQRHWKR